MGFLLFHFSTAVMLDNSDYFTQIKVLALKNDVEGIFWRINVFVKYILYHLHTLVLTYISTNALNYKYKRYSQNIFCYDFENHNM